MLLQVSGLLALALMSSAIPVSYVPGAQQLQQLSQPQQQYQLAQQAQAQAQAQAQQAQPAYQAQQQAYQQQQPAYQQQQPGPQQQYAAPPQLAKLGPGGPPRPGGPYQPDPEDYDPNPQYQFSFDVKDDQFTNYQNRKESRDGNKISGSYSVVDSDGFIRTVKYTADPLEGFKAEVTREPTSIVVKFPQPQQLALPQQGQGQASIQDSPSGPSGPSGPGGAELSARQQATQQYLQTSGVPQPQSRVFTTLVHPHSLPSPQRLANLQAQQAGQQQAQQFALPPTAPQPYQAPGLAAKSAKAGAIGFASQQPGGGNVVYQAYQQ